MRDADLGSMVVHMVPDEARFIAAGTAYAPTVCRPCHFSCFIPSSAFNVSGI